MWNPTVALGTVTHEYIGYLLPMGPFFVVFHRARTSPCGWPSGSGWARSSSPRAPGVLYLSRVSGSRPGPGTRPPLAYMLSPYFLQYAGRISVILLPWAGLPVDARLRRSRAPPRRLALPGPLRPGRGAGQRHQRQLHPLRGHRPRSCGSSTRWWSPREATWRQALGGGAARSAVLTSGRCLWWVVGLEVEAAYGVNVLKYTETVPSTSATSDRLGDPPRPRATGTSTAPTGSGPWTRRGRPLHPARLAAGDLFAVPGAGASSPPPFVRWRRPRLLPPAALRRAWCSSVGPIPYNDPTRGRARPQGVHDGHDRRAGPALDRPGHAARPAGARHAAGQRADRAVAAALHRRARHGAPGRRSRRGQQPVASSTATPSPPASPSPPSCPSYASGRDRPPERRPIRAPACSPSPATTSPPTGGGTPSTPPSPRFEPQLRHPRAADHGLHRHGRHALRGGRPHPGRHRQHGTRWPRWPRLMGAGDVLVEYDQQYERYGIPHPQLLAPAAARPRWASPTRSRSARPGPTSRPTPRSTSRTWPSRPTSPGRRPLVDYTVTDPRPISGPSPTAAPLVVEGDATGLNNLAGLGLLDNNNAIYYAGTLAGDPRGSARLAGPGRAARAHRHQPQAGLPWDTMTANAGYTETPERRTPPRPTRATARSSCSPAPPITQQDVRVLRRSGQRHRQQLRKRLTYTPEDARLQRHRRQLRHGLDHRDLRPGPGRPVVAGAVREPRDHGPHHARAAPAGRPPRWISRVTADLRRQGPGALPTHERLARGQRGRRSPSPPGPSTRCGVTINSTTDDHQDLHCRPRPSASPRSRSPGRGAPGDRHADPDARHASGPPRGPTVSPSS